MKNLPIDTSGMSLQCAAPPVAVVDFKSKLPKADENGAPLFTVELVALHNGGAEIMPVRLTGLPPESLVQGTPVRVSGLVATHWEMGDWSGVAFRADRIDPTPPAQPPLFTAGNGSGTSTSAEK
jgi:hypothetical protein